MPAPRISLEKAKPNKLFYFVANVAVFRESDGRCLIMKRDEREVVHPGKYALIGGKLEWDDPDLSNWSFEDGVSYVPSAVEKLLAREAREEAGIEIDLSGMIYIESMVFIRPDGVPVVFVKFGAKYKSGEVTPEAGAFTDFAWVNTEEVQNYDCIDGVYTEIPNVIAEFSKRAA